MRRTPLTLFCVRCYNYGEQTSFSGCTLYSYVPVCIIQVLGNTGIKVRSKPGHTINSLGHFRKLVEIRSPKCSLDDMLAGDSPIFSSLTTSFCNCFWDGAEVGNEALNKT